MFLQLFRGIFLEWLGRRSTLWIEDKCQLYQISLLFPFLPSHKYGYLFQTSLGCLFMPLKFTKIAPETTCKSYNGSCNSEHSSGLNLLRLPCVYCVCMGLPWPVWAVIETVVELLLIFLLQDPEWFPSLFSVGSHLSFLPQSPMAKCCIFPNSPNPTVHNACYSVRIGGPCPLNSLSFSSKNGLIHSVLNHCAFTVSAKSPCASFICHF